MRRTHCQHVVNLEFETQRLKADSSLNVCGTPEDVLWYESSCLCESDFARRSVISVPYNRAMPDSLYPQRIACLQPSATVILASVAELDRVVACLKYCACVVHWF